MQGNQRLVGRDDMLTIFYCLQYQGTGRLIAANQLNHYLAFRIVHDCFSVVSKTNILQTKFFSPFQFPCCCHGNAYATPCAASYLFSIAHQYRCRSTANGAEAH